MIPESSIQPTERHNAIISYCFLAPFMLFSRDERFSNDFVRKHTRYATLIQIAFLALIVVLVRSRNFSSIIIFGASWVHILLFIGFFILLGFLATGIYRAFLGQSPKISLPGLSWSSLKYIGEEVKLDEAQKTPLILSHIPFIGTYLSHKYGDFLVVGEKFGNWIFIIAAVLLWLDPSFTLFITWITLATFWIVYQAILVSSGDNMRLIGGKLPGVAKCHTIIISTLLYMKGLINHDKTLPIWSNILQVQNEKYKNEISGSGNTKFTIPFISIPSIFNAWKTHTLGTESINAILINIISLYALYMGNTPLIMLTTLGVWWSYWQAKNNKNTSLPLISESSLLILKILDWKKKKSTPQEIHISSIQ